MFDPPMFEASDGARQWPKPAPGFKTIFLSINGGRSVMNTFRMTCLLSTTSYSRPMNENSAWPDSCSTPALFGSFQRNLKRDLVLLRLLSVRLGGIEWMLGGSAEKSAWDHQRSQTYIFDFQCFCVLAVAICWMVESKL